MRILVTGATGCVGRSLARELLDDGHEVVLCVRDPARLPDAVRTDHRTTVVVGDLREIARMPEVCQDVDAAVLVATAWGGPETAAITRDANAALTDRLIAGGCSHVLYFATASVLSQDGRLLPEAEEIGTDYIRAKAGLVRAMEERGGQNCRITGLFPTLVLGGRLGSKEDPPSHLARLLREVRPRAGILRLLSFRAGRLHLVHARDIARIVARLVSAGTDGAAGTERVVLGNPALTVDEVLAQTSRAWGRRYLGWVRVTPRRAEWIIRTFRIRLAAWDRWCLEHPDQSFPQAVWPPSLGLEPVMPDLTTGIELVGAA